MFISGILLFEYYHFQKAKLHINIGTLCLLIGLAIFGLRNFYEFNRVLTVAALFVLFFIFCLEAFTQGTYANRWLLKTPIRWLGNMSYSYFLLHGLTLKALFLVLSYVIPPENQFDALFYFLWIPFFICTLISSFILFIVVERPLSLDQSRVSK
jgi:peptidoglycan/LPS O-acetylase OafA/YrhL